MSGVSSRFYLVQAWLQALIPAALLFLGFHWSLGQTMTEFGVRLDNLTVEMANNRKSLQTLHTEMVKQSLLQAGLQVRVENLQHNLAKIEDRMDDR